MKDFNIVYESPTKRDYLTIKKYLRQKIPVYIVEPFHAFHHKKGIRFFPPPLPEFVDDLIKKGKIHLLKAEQINAKEIYPISADRAVDAIKSIFPEYRKEHKELFSYVSDTLKSPVSESVFKKNLCDRLARFYSVNMLLHRVEELLGTDAILFYPDMNVRSYLFFKSLLSKTNQDFFEHPNIRFPVRTHIAAFFEDAKNYLTAVSRHIGQTLASGILGEFGKPHEKKKKRYSYGMTVISPLRQLTDNQRGPDFIVDNKKIRAEDVVYFPLVDLTGEQKDQLERMPGTVHYLPGVGRCFSNFTEWKGLLRHALKKNLFLCSEEIDTACNALFNYFRWLKVLKDVQIKHFITHCDFGVSHIGRNLALNQAGVQTWYFTDSMNFGCNMKLEKNKCKMRHPFWTFMYYDHFVTWHEFLEQFFNEHPGTFKQTHVVGCIWSEHSRTENKMNGATTGDFKEKFKLLVFDTTYSRKGYCTYEEGLAFAEHILRLTDDFPDIYIFFKEKKKRDIHIIFDPILGPKLLDLYNKMGKHPRITTYTYQEDASNLVSLSNMVVSFPFTSTTFEALSANKPAIWHDPLGCYMSTPYSKIDGVLTHNYEELKTKVMEIKDMETNTYRNPIPLHSPLMDPYRDGKAIDRFRELLYSAEESMK